MDIGTSITVGTSAPDTITENVFAVGIDGKLLWRIEDVLPQRANSFSGGRIRKNGILEFWNTDGWWVAVDRDTGRAIGMYMDHGPTGEGSDNQLYQPIIRQNVSPEIR